MTDSDPSTPEPPEDPASSRKPKPAKLEMSVDLSFGDNGKKGKQGEKGKGGSKSASAEAAPTMSALPRDQIERWRATTDGKVRDVMATDVDRVVSALMHLWPILFPVLAPFCLLVPLVLWLPFRARSPLIDDHGREVMNVILTLVMLVCVPCIGWLALVIWVPVWLVSLVRAAVSAGSSELFRYPMVLRPIK